MHTPSKLMIVLAIIAVLASIALPVYKDYVISSKMTEPWGTLAKARTSVAY